MESIADHHEAIRRHDQLANTRHQRNVFGLLAALGWLMAITQWCIWLFRN